MQRWREGGVGRKGLKERQRLGEGVVFLGDFVALGEKSWSARNMFFSAEAGGAGG